MENRNYTVYMHRNKTNGKVYIGVTGKAPEKRFGCNGANYRSSRHFFSAIQKYGWDNFDHLILHENLDQHTAYELEKQLIEKYGSMDPNSGYNIIAGGRGGQLGIKRPEHVIQRIIETHTGRKRSEETRAKLRAAQARRVSSGMKGRHHTDDVRNRLSEIGHTKIGELNSFYGRKHTEESKEKMRAAKLNDPNLSERARKGGEAVAELLRKPVDMLDKSGAYIRTFPSATDAALFLTGKKHSHISQVCTGKGPHKTALGYLWRFSEVV